VVELNAIFQFKHSPHLRFYFTNLIPEEGKTDSFVFLTFLATVEVINHGFFASTRSSIKRLVGLSGVIAQKDPIDPGWMEWLLRKLVRSRLNDLMAMENIVMNSNLCYTLVRLPFLTQGTAQFTSVQFFTMVINSYVTCLYVLNG